MFQNVIVPEATPSEMRGVASLLTLISNPKSKAALEFLNKLSAEKDEAVAAAAQAKTDRDAAESALEEAHESRMEMDSQVKDKLADAVAKQQRVDEMMRQITERENALRVAEAKHAEAVDDHKDAKTAAELSLLARENAVYAREQKLARDTADLAARQSEFDRKMAPILEAAKLA